MRKAFTLVELLVVIGIIALLLGILLPTLGSARRSGELAVCGSNLRQLHAAVVLYANDHAGRAPPGAALFFDASRVAESNLRRWHGERDDDDDAFNATRGPIWEYLETDEIKRCPSLRDDELRSNIGQAAAFEASAGGYGYNSRYVGLERNGDTRSELGARLVEFRDSARTVLFTDAALLRPQLIEYSFAEPPASGLDPSIHFRHGDRKANVMWLDGHVSQEVFAFTSSNIYGATVDDHQEAGIGWFLPDSVELFDRE
ncbi:MAG: prepilin-type N-terminal cleavage/methylation domain-containing protein [Planctomycetota bacterium]